MDAPNHYHQPEEIRMVPWRRVSVLSLRATLEWVAFLAQRQPDRRARKFKTLPQRIHQIALVGVGQRVGAGAEQHEARWPALGLGDVIEAEPAPRHRRRRMRVDRVLEPAIERSRRK